VAPTWDCYELVRDTCLLQGLMQPHAPLVWDSRISFAVDNDDGRCVTTNVGEGRDAPRQFGAIAQASEPPQGPSLPGAAPPADQSRL
jgi:hypothetical protein